MEAVDPRNVQAAQYVFPYHHLPHAADGIWYVGRHLHWGFQYLSLLESVVSEVEKLCPESVLDFGCGDGRLLSELAVRAPTSELWGVEIVERALHFASGFNDEAKVRFARSLEELRGKRFDVIVASEVLEHIPPDECAQIVSGLGELVSPSGALVVTVPTHNIRVSRKHFRHFDENELAALLGPHFELDSSRYIQRVGLVPKFVEGMAVNRFFRRQLGAVFEAPRVRLPQMGRARDIDQRGRDWSRSSTGADVLETFDVSTR